jgi:hypothetical protein
MKITIDIDLGSEIKDAFISMIRSAQGLVDKDIAKSPKTPSKAPKAEEVKVAKPKAKAPPKAPPKTKPAKKAEPIPVEAEAMPASVAQGFLLELLADKGKTVAFSVLREFECGTFSEMTSDQYEGFAARARERMAE